jgi:hypothetical protein
MLLVPITPRALTVYPAIAHSHGTHYYTVHNWSILPWTCLQLPWSWPTHIFSYGPHWCSFLLDTKALLRAPQFSCSPETSHSSCNNDQRVADVMDSNFPSQLYNSPLDMELPMKAIYMYGISNCFLKCTQSICMEEVTASWNVQTPSQDYGDHSKHPGIMTLPKKYRKLMTTDSHQN